jgi:FtsP/CotA-like multicopper oxidase with cupredoxin domain
MAAVAVVAVGVIGTVVLSGDDGGSDGASVALSTPGPWAPEEGAAFQEPEQITRPPVKGRAVIAVKLHARSHLTTVAGSQVYARPYNGEFVGPTIHARPGDTIKVTFDNDLGKNVLTNIHYHGLHVSPEGESDNIFRTFKPNPDPDNPYTSTVVLEHNQPRGTYWYHAHFHGISDGQVMGGLSGLIMLDGLTSLLPDDFAHVPERQITLRDVQLAKNEDGSDKFTEDGYNILADNSQIDPAPASTHRLVNGLYKPTFTMRSGEYELWHLANIGSDVFYKVALAKRKESPDKLPLDEQSFFVVAEDGVPVWEVWSGRELLIPPGKRFDVLVLGRAKGTYELLTLPYAQTSNNQMTKLKPIPCDPPPAGPNCIGKTETLATITTAGDSGSGPPPLPTRVAPEGDPTAKDLSDVPIADDDKKTFTFDYPGGAPFRAVIYTGPPPEPLDKAIFDIKQMPIVAPVLGSTQEWTLVNKTRDDHPFHIHINGFQVTKTNEVTTSNPEGNLVDYNAHGHQDVVNIPKARNVNGATIDGKVVIRQHYADFDGWYVFHCHILNHEDVGMMRTIQVRKDASVKPSPPPEAAEHGGHAMPSRDRYGEPLGR